MQDTPIDEEKSPQPAPVEVPKGKKSAPAAEPSPEHVRKLARALFDGTRPLHELSKDDRQILELAAQHFNTTLTLTKKKPFPRRSRAFAHQAIERSEPQETRSADRGSVVAAA